MSEPDPPRLPGSPDPVAPDNVHRLDTRQADLGRDLRRLFASVIEEDVPAELAALSRALEVKLAEEAGSGEEDGPVDPPA